MYLINLLAECLWAVQACVLQSKKMVSLSHHYLKEINDLERLRKTSNAIVREVDSGVGIRK